MPRTIRLAFVSLAVFLALPASAHDRDRERDREVTFRAHLTGDEEVPVIAHTGSGTLTMTLSADGSTLTFQFDYEGLTGNPAAAHVHVGQKGVNGGVSFFFCGGGGKPACPASTSGSVSGTVVAADVVGPTGQGIPAGDLAVVLALMRDGLTYANMHTEAHPGGEIRGQVKGGRHGFLDLFFAPMLGAR